MAGSQGSKREVVHKHEPTGCERAWVVVSRAGGLWFTMQKAKTDKVGFKKLIVTLICCYSSHQTRIRPHFSVLFLPLQTGAPVEWCGSSEVCWQILTPNFACAPLAARGLLGCASEV